jgi:hypothetical protein
MKLKKKISVTTITIIDIFAFVRRRPPPPNGTEKVTMKIKTENPLTHKMGNDQSFYNNYNLLKLFVSGLSRDWVEARRAMAAFFQQRSITN